jgi:DUF2075 family protein
LVVGGSTSTTETLSNTGFTLGGDDLFVAGLAGVEGNVYTDGSFIVAATTTYGDNAITESSGDFTFTLGAAGDDLVIATGNLKVGNGTPDVALGGEDFYVEGTLEADGAARFDSTIAANGAVTMGANIVMADNSVTGIDTLTFTDTAGTVAGIQNQNLVDKSAAEEISGAWEVQDDTDFAFGNGGDFAFLYDETTDDRLELVDAADNLMLHVTDQGTTGDLVVTGDLTVSGSELYITPAASSASTTEGTLYYDSDDDNLYVYADGSFVDLTASAGGGDDFDTVYNNDAGGERTIVVDAGSMSWDLFDGATDYSFIVDIQGSGNTFVVQDGGAAKFTIADAGAVTSLGTFTFGADSAGVDVTTHGTTASSQMLWDTSDDRLEFDGADVNLQDADILQFGDAQDIAMTWSGTAFNISQAGTNSAINVGVDGAGIDFKLFGDTASSYAEWDQSDDRLELDGADINLQDSDILQFGDAQDVTMTWNGSTFAIGQAGDGQAITVGADDNGMDFKVFGETTGQYVEWDESADKLNVIGQLDVGVDDTGHDVTFYGATTGRYMKWDESEDKLVLYGLMDVGVDDTGYDVTFYGATTGSYMLWDESDDRLEFDGTDVNLQDADILQFGDAQDVTMTWSGSAFNIGQAGDGQAINVGVDDNGMDFKVFGETSGRYMHWDESADKLILYGLMDVGVDDTGYDVKFFGATTGSYMLWDESDDRLEFDGADVNLQDSDIVQFGDSQDMTAYWDGSDFYLDAAANNTMFYIGDDTNDIDITWYAAGGTVVADASGNLITVDGIDLLLNDDDQLRFGNASDIVATWNGTSSRLDVTANADDTELRFGASGGNVFDLLMYGDAAGEQFDWDASSAELTVKTTVADTTDNSGLLVEITDNTATSGDGRGVYVDVKDGSASPVAAIDVLAEDTTQALSIGARIQAAASATITKGLEILAGAGGAITTALDVSDAEVGTALSYGANTILGTGDIGSTSSEVGDVYLADDKSVKFGSDQDATIMYDETTDDQLEIDGAGVFIGDTLTIGVDDTGHDVKFFGATSGSYFLWDEDEDRLEFDGADVNLQDADILQFGDAQDVTMTWSGSAFNIAQAGDGQAINVGADDNGMDFKIFGETSGRYIQWDESADKLVLYGLMDVGVDDTGYDVKFFGATSGAYMLWDEDADELELDGATISVEDSDQVKFGDAADITMAWDGSDFDILQATADSSIKFGADGAGIDVVWYGDTASSTFTWDQSADKLILNGSDIQLSDDDVLEFGDTPEVSVAYDEAGDDRLEITGTNASLYVEDVLTLGKQAETINGADDSVTITASYLEVTATAGGDDIILATTGVLEGDLLVLVNVASNTFQIDGDTATMKIDGGSDLDVPQYDGAIFVFDGTNWLQLTTIPGNS